MLSCSQPLAWITSLVGRFGFLPWPSSRYVPGLYGLERLIDPSVMRLDLRYGRGCTLVLFFKRLWLIKIEKPTSQPMIMCPD